MPDHTALFKRVRRANKLACDFEPPVKDSARRALGRCLLQGHSVALYREQKGTISYRYTSDCSTGGAAERARTGARTPEEAFLFADGYPRNKAVARQGNPPQGQSSSAPGKGGPTIREAYDCIRRNLEVQFEEKQWREILKILYCTEQVWCLDRPFASLSGRDVAQYVATRVEVGLSLPADFSRRPRLGPCKAVTAVNDLHVLAALCRKLGSEADLLTGETPFSVIPSNGCCFRRLRRGCAQSRPPSGTRC